MKKRLLSIVTAMAMVLTMMPAMAFAETEIEIEINEVNFPDDSFREIVMELDQYDDGILMEKEIRETQYLSIDEEGISDLTGIQYFTNLKELYCEENQLTTLDLSGLTELTNLDCSYNQLTSLNIKGCENLLYLYAHHNNLTSLELNPTAGYNTVRVEYNDLADISDLKCNGNELEWASDFAFHPQNWMKPVELNAANFPDSVLREELSGEYNDDNQDGVLSPEEITNITSLWLWDTMLEDLTGIQYLFALEDLNCDSCYITKLPQLPEGLKDLSVSNNYLTELPQLPESLEYLGCANNQLTSLPVLPDSIKDLYCSNNKLTSLPTLPASLETLDCYGNNLKTLPALPASLIELECYNNELVALPALPAALETLYCDNNNLTSLPALPASLTYINCDNNELTSLPAMPLKLQYLRAEYNKIKGVVDLSQQKFLTSVYLYDNYITGVILNPMAKYGTIYLADNAMKSEADVTGRTDIVWNDANYWFGHQKTVCEINGHKYKLKRQKATFNRSGYEEQVCSVCQNGDYETYIYYGIVNTPKNVTKAYTGKVLAAPKFVVKTSKGKTLKQGTDYTVKKVTSAKLKNVGKYKYKITLKGTKYSGSTFAYVIVNPKATSINKLTKPAKKQIKVTWQKRTAQVTGYQIRYSTSAKFNSYKTATVKNYKTNTKTIKNLKAKKKYYVKIRTYKTVNGVKYYSAWSKVKTITTK